MSNDMHQQYLESKYEMVEHGIKTMPGLENMRKDLKDDLISHVASYIEDYVEEDFPILKLTMEWFAGKVAETMSSEDLDAMAREWGIEQEKQDVKNMPPHFRYLVE